MPRTLILSMSLLAGCFFAAAGAADVTPSSPKSPATEWPQWRGADRSGLSPDTGLSHDWKAHPPKLLWTADGLGGGYASVSVAGGRIYSTGNQSSGQAVICLNAADGKELWKHNITDTVPKHGYDGSRCTPSIDGDRLYAIASSGKIACLKTADGSEVWSKDFRTEWGGRMMSGWVSHIEPTRGTRRRGSLWTIWNLVKQA